MNKRLINEDLDNHFSIEFSPLNSLRGYDKNAYRVANLLVWLQSFYNHIYNARKNLKVSKLNSVDSTKSVSTFTLEISKSLSSIKDQDSLEITANFIRNQFKLTKNWDFTIKTLFVSNQLFVPIEVPPIEIYRPYKMLLDEKFKGGKLESMIEKLNWEKGSSSEKDRILRNLKEKQEYPSIIVKKQTSTTQLINWIRENKDELDQLFSKLEKPIKTKVNQNTLFLGQSVWIFKNEGYTFEKIADTIEDLISRKDDPEDYELYRPIYTEVGAQKYYSRFIKHLTSLDLQ